MRSRSRGKGGEHGASRGGRGVRASGRREGRRRVCRAEGQSSAVDWRGIGPGSTGRRKRGGAAAVGGLASCPWFICVVRGQGDG